MEEEERKFLFETPNHKQITSAYSQKNYRAYTTGLRGGEKEKGTGGKKERKK